MTTRDEESLSVVLVRGVPTLVFIDGTTWPSESPPLVESIAAATTSRVLLWDRQAVPSLPTIRDSHGSVIGPSTGDVISFDKPRIVRDGTSEVLVSGSLTWSSGDPSATQLEFHRLVWGTVRKTLPHKVRTLEGGIAQGFLAGPDAVSWWAQNSEARSFGLNAIRNSAIPIVDSQ